MGPILETQNPQPIVCSESLMMTAIRAALMSFVGTILCQCTQDSKCKSMGAIVDETKFKNHAEKEFWEKAYLAYVASGSTHASRNADEAVADRRLRMEGLIKPGVKVA